ncbi:MAG TPA: MiaB/RimO family radical SAM methylthiotransferase [Longimicrobiales bacterium]|nr:MiaB/RimO family radical SAM methylthiotransferase [Longimicrobiales bacterium]
MAAPRPASHLPRKAYVETYGCQMNVADGELMQGILAARGYEIVGTPEEADVVLVNTCAIREHAEQRVIGRVGELYRIKRERPDLVIGVTGCMAQRLGGKLLEQAPYVDLVMGPDAYRGLPETLGRLRPALAAPGDEAAAAPVAPSPAPREPDAPRSARRSLPVMAAAAPPAAEAAGRIAALDFSPHEHYEGLEARRASRVSAWVPVQRGCNYRCTYCIVPYVRGDEKNRAPEQVLDEVRRAVDSGIPEVVLLGQTVNSYEHGDWDFPRMLRAVARVDGVRRVRFTSPHPNDFTRGLVEVMAEEPAVCEQLHLPVQSGHDRTLKRMLRRYTVAEYLEKLDWVREAVPGIALSTDIIVAFPGETEEEYEATLELVRRVRYDDAYLYKYSPRDGTPATRLPPEQFVAAAVAQERLERLIELHRGIQAEINRAEVGRVVEVLVEREARTRGDVLGRTRANKVVAFAGEPAWVGRFLDVRLTGTTGATFTGEVVAAEREGARVA